MSLIKGKYQRLSIDLEKSEYKDLCALARARGCSLVFIVRSAIRTTLKNNHISEYNPGRT